MMVETEQVPLRITIPRESDLDIELERELEKGAYSVVYLAKCKTSGKQYAIKVALDIGGRFTEAFTNELAIMKMLPPHPFVITYFQAGVCPVSSRMFFITEFCAQGDLFNVLSDVTILDVDTVREYARQIILALRHVHASGYVHADLKMENLLLHADGSIRLCDFGSSGLVNAPVLRGVMCGTPMYMAPNRWRQAPLTPEDDCWALGAVLFTMFTGLPPWYTESRNPYLISVMRRKPLHFPDVVPIVAQEMILGLLEENTKNRLSTDDLLGHAFFEGVNWEY
jgi:serine/threonine protein kinase